ncbi:MAG: M81 family metallopeptidase [Candidatus Latescibacteria bacterium]|jgi:microcystin degradation protein MlrC|nr:M81 family metallopeptidase [Candidatus Latescibacterota bacterium]
MRIALAGIYQESHSFSPAPATLGQFEAGYLLHGEEIPDQLAGLNHEVGGALEAAEGHEVVPLTYASAGSSGMPIRHEAYETLSGEILSRLRQALPVDGVLMAMHGAMASEGHDDATGHLLAEVRKAVGVDVPVVATLDLHANVTRLMARSADALVGYHTAPHIDQRDTGRRGMALLLGTVSGKTNPEMAVRQLPMILPSENGRTTDGPYAGVMDQAKELENAPGVLAASAFSVQPWLDLPEVGCCVVVVCDGDRSRACAEADRIADAFWACRGDFEPSLVKVEDAIDLALEDARGPFVFSDSADAPSSGAPGDSTVLLKALLNRRVEKPALLNIVDPEASAAAFRAGVGATLDLTVGGAFSSTFYKPVIFKGYVKSLTDGSFRNRGPGFHGVQFSMGRTAVVASGGLHLIVMERPVIQWDPELYRSQGLEPAEAWIVVAKSPAAFRAAYESLAGEILVLDAPGVCSPNLLTFPWKRVPRPMYPFDAMSDALPRPD